MLSKSTNTPSSSSAAPLLGGKTLNWISWDPRRIATISAHNFLKHHFECDGVPVRQVSPEEFSQVPQLATNIQAGLVLWSPDSTDSISTICRGLRAVMHQQPRAFRICYLANLYQPFFPLLVEAGAQIVVSELTSLQNALRFIAPKIPLSNRGSHPLTEGLHERLPWAEIDCKRVDNAVANS